MFSVPARGHSAVAFGTAHFQSCCLSPRPPGCQWYSTTRAKVILTITIYSKTPRTSLKLRNCTPWISPYNKTPSLRRPFCWPSETSTPTSLPLLRTKKLPSQRARRHFLFRHPDLYSARGHGSELVPSSTAGARHPAAFLKEARSDPWGSMISTGSASTWLVVFSPVHQMIRWLPVSGCTGGWVKERMLAPWVKNAGKDEGWTMPEKNILESRKKKKQPASPIFQTCLERRRG